MPTIIDSLVVALGLDAKAYTKGAGEVRADLKKTTEGAHASAVDMESSGKRAAQSFKSIRNEVVALSLAFVGARTLKGFVEDIVSGDAAASRFARNIGVSTDRLSAWGLAARDAGGDASDAMSTFGAMAEMYQSYVQHGQTGKGAELRALGLNDPNVLRDPEQALLRLADAGERMRAVMGDKAGNARFANLAEAIGVSPAIVTLLEKGRGEVERTIAAKHQEAAATEEQGRQAEVLQKKLSNLYAEIMGRSRPAIYGLVDALVSFFGQEDHVKTAGAVIVGVFGAIAVAAGVAYWPIIALAGAITGAILAWDKLHERSKDWNKADPGHKLNGMGRLMLDAGSWLFGGSDATAGGQRGRGSVTVPLDPPSAAMPATPVNGGIEQFFRANGFSPEQAHGIASGIAAEGGAVNAKNPTSSAYGIGQWLTARQRDFRRIMGRDIHGSSLQQQLQFMLWEMHNSERGAGFMIQSARTADEAGHAYLANFMRPGGGLAGDLRRFHGRVPHGALAHAGRGAARVVHNETHIHGGIHVQTAATDARGIAADLPGAIRRRRVTSQADRGMD